MAETDLVIQGAKISRFAVVKQKIGKAQNFLIGLALLYFVFFGWIANSGVADVQNNPQNYAPDNILFVYTSLFNFHDTFYPWGLTVPEFAQVIYFIPCAFSLIILILIGIYQSYRENFVIYGIKNNIWTVPFIILISWGWTALNARESLFTTVGRYFSSYHGYVNIIVLLVIYGGAGVIGSWLKTLSQNREALMKSRAFESLKAQNEQRSIDIGIEIEKETSV